MRRRRGMSKRARLDLANELDSVLTSFEELTDSLTQSVNEDLRYDARYIAEFIYELQEILRVLDVEEQLIK